MPLCHAGQLEADEGRSQFGFVSKANKDLAAALLAKHSGFPLAAFQEALIAPGIENSKGVAMCVALHPSCGVNLRADLAAAKPQSGNKNSATTKGCDLRLEEGTKNLKPTPLSLAIRAGRFDVMKELLAAGADVSSVHYSVRNGVRVFGMGFRVFQSSTRCCWSPLFVAAGSGANGSDIALLLSKGVNPNRGDGNTTPLYEAARTNNVSALQALLMAKDIDLYKTGRCMLTPLHAAVHHKCFEAVKILVKHGASVERRDNQYAYTPLLAAVHKQEVAIAKYLIEHGADVTAREWENGQRLINCCAASYAHRGPNILYVAAEKDLSELIPYLLEKGADSYPGGSTLHYAAHRGNTKVVNTLLSHGADVNGNKSDQGNTPLHSAATATRVCVEAIKALLAHGTDVDECNELGLTAVQLLDKSDNNAVIAILSAEGAKHTMNSTQLME